MMRILFVISGLSLGGAERQVVLLSKELVRLGHAVSIYTLNREVARADELAGSAVEISADQKRVRLDLGVLLRLHRHISAWRPDVVHGFLYDGNLYARLSGLGTAVPVLNSERNDNYAVSTAQTIGYRLTSALVGGIVANSHAGAAFAERLHRVPPQCVHTVWNGIDLTEIDARIAKRVQPAHEIWNDKGIKRVCVVGAIKPQKDYLLALRVMRQLIDTDPLWRFICVGDELSDATSNYKLQVLAEQDRLGLAPFVKFVGHRRDVAEVAASCEVLLVTSLHEGFPNVVLEAMACGTPVASTDYSDVRRILPTPWQVVASREEGELARAVSRCLAEHDVVAAAQRHWVEANATIAASAKSLLNVYAGYVNVPTQVAQKEVS